MTNQAGAAVHVTAKSAKISLPGGAVAFSMRSADRMSFEGGATTAREAVQRMKIEDPAAAGRLVQDFAVLGTVKAQVEVQMLVEVSLLPGVYSHHYAAEHTFSSHNLAGSEASIPGCLNGSTVQQLAIRRLTVLQNDPVAARAGVAVAVEWYKAWSFTADFPPTEWRLVNKRTREPIAYAAVPAATLRERSARAATTLNVSIPKEYAVAAGDAFRRTMDLSELSVEMVGTGHAGAASGQCRKFAQLLENFAYPVYVWDAAANAAYARDPYPPNINPCKPSQVQNYLDALLGVTSIDMVSSNGSHAWLKVAVTANITDGLDKVGTTAKLALLNLTKIPPVRVSLQQPDGEVVMTAAATFEGCLVHFPTAPYWCKQASASIVIDDRGTGMAMGHVIADLVTSKVTNFTMRISGVDVVKAANAPGGNHDPRLPTVMATVAGAYPQPVHIDLISKGLNGTRSRIDHAQANYTDSDGFSIRVSPRYPAPIYVSGQYNETVERRLYAEWLQINAGTVNVDIRCESELVGSGSFRMNPSNGRDQFPLSARVNIQDALNSRCFGGNAAAVSSDGVVDQPPFQFFAQIAPTTSTDPFLFNSSYSFANSSDGSIQLNLSEGFQIDSICRSPVLFTLTTPAPGFLTVLGDIDITAQTAQLVYEGQVGAAIEHSKDRVGSGPHVKVRGEQMIFDFIVHVDDAFVVGSMINNWYSTWHDLVFQLTGTGLSIVSAPTNSVSFSHQMSLVEKGFSFSNSASSVTDMVTSLTLTKSTETVLEAVAKVWFNLTESVAQGWGFPPFNIAVPPTHFKIVTFGPEGDLNYSLGALETSSFDGFRGKESIGPIAFTADTRDREATGKWVAAFVNNALGCTHHPWRTLEENRTLSIQLIGDTTPAYEEQCLFQKAIGKVSYPLIRYPYSDNATHQPHTVRVESLQLTTHAIEAGSRPDVELALVLGNSTDPSIRNVMANLPSFNLTLNGQLEGQEAKSTLLAGQLNFDPNRFRGMTSAALTVAASQVGHLLSTLVETSMDNISAVYSFDVQPDTPSQELLASVLHSAAEAASSCLLSPAPTPMPTSAHASLVEKIVGRAAAGLQSLLNLAPVDSSADPLDRLDTVIEVQTTAKTLAVIGHANITSAATSLTRLLGDESVALSYGELGLDLYRAADGDVIGSPVAAVRLLSLSTEEIAVKVNTSAGAAMDAASQLGADYLMQPQVNTIARLVLRGKNDRHDGHGAGATHEGDSHEASSARLTGSPEVDVDIDVRIPGSGEEFPCDPQPATLAHACTPMSGYVTSFSPAEGVCVYVGVGIKGLEFAITLSVPNPLPFPYTMQAAQVELHGEITDSSGAVTKYNTIATAVLPKPITFPPHSDDTVRA